MLRKKKWVILGGLILLTICMVVPGVMVLASSGASVTASGTMPLLIFDVTANPSTVIQTSKLSYSTITITAHLQNGPPLSGLVINLSASAPGSVVPVTVTTNSNGQATANSTLSILITQQTIVTVKATAGVIKGQTNVTFNPPPITSTNIILTSFPNTSYCGQTVYFGVAVLASGSKTIPSGTVTFYDGPTSLGTNPLFFGLTGFADNLLSVGSHNITAVYVGNNNYATSTSKVVIQKVLAKTVCTWPVKPNPCNFGQTCTFKIHIGVQSPGTGNPTGNVTFYDGGKTLGTGNLGTDGFAQFSISSLSKGTHSITAVYGGNDNFDGCNSGAFSQVIK
jgi:hypothetical protein